MSGFDFDLFRSLADLNKKLADQAKQKPRDTAPIPPMRSKVVDGVKYLRAEDVAEALRVTDSAVRVRVHIMKWLAK